VLVVCQRGGVDCGVGERRVGARVRPGHVPQWDRVERRRIAKPRHRGHRIDGRHAVAKHPAEDGEAAVLIVKAVAAVVQAVGAEGVVSEVEKPLIRGAVGIVAEFGHRDRTADVVGHGTFRRLWLVDHRRELGDTADQYPWLGACDRESAPLNHKAGHRAMDECVVVFAGVRIGKKVGGSQGRGAGAIWAGLIEEFDVDQIIRLALIRRKPDDRAGDIRIIVESVDVNRLRWSIDQHAQIRKRRQHADVRRRSRC
jgi:hypothetical protein